MTPPEKCDSDFRFYRASAVAFILAALAIKVGLVVSGTILSGPGDDSNRIYHAIRWSLDPSVTFSSRFLTDIWPHGPKILMGLPLLLFRSIGLGGIVDPVKACLIETAVIYSVCAYLVFLIVTRLVDSRSGFLAVASLYAMEIQSRMALSGMAEVYCLLAILISILCFLNWDGRSMASKWFVVATLASLASTLFRGDMILFIGIFGLILLWKKKFLSAIIYWAISYSYFTGKKIYQILSEQEGISYFNAGSFYDFGESSLGQRFFDLAGFFYDAFLYSPALIVYLAGFLGLVLLAFHPKGRVISLVFILYTAPFIVAMLAGRMFFQERMLFFSYVMMAMGAGYTVSRFVGLLRFNGWRRLSRTAFIVYLLFCVLPFAHSHWEMANR
ncbi:MAG: hypothetical protein H6751_18510, partial [Candidatus Omnitrophica bacterium]|nr:hypothetical protein [Candidatus Omnitrophota bacterium]